MMEEIKSEIAPSLYNPASFVAIHPYYEMEQTPEMIKEGECRDKRRRKKAIYRWIIYLIIMAIGCPSILIGGLLLTILSPLIIWHVACAAIIFYGWMLLHIVLVALLEVD